MDHILHDRLQYELLLLENDFAKATAKLDPVKFFLDCRLRRHESATGKNTYYLKNADSKEYKHVKKNKLYIVKKVVEAYHYNAEIETIKKNINLVRSLLDEYADYDYKSIDAKLPHAYQSKSKSLMDSYSLTAAKWREAKLEFQKNFPENFPENKKHTAADGTLVKTISELVIYNSLLDAGLFPIYELPLADMNYGPPLYPDFTVLSPIDMKTVIIIEHVGRLDDHSYREAFAKRLGRYILNGFIPGVNLFFTFSDKDGNIDALQINKIIADIKGLR